MRGGDETRRLSPAAAMEEARQAAVGGDGEEGTTAQQTALVALSDLGWVAGKSRALSEGLWGRAFLTAYNSASDGERLRRLMPSTSRSPSSSESCPTSLAWMER